MLASKPSAANRGGGAAPLRRLALLALGLSGGFFGGAMAAAAPLPQLANVLPAEAPSSVLSAQAGKGELSATGSWQLSLLSSVEFSKAPTGGLQLGQAQPLLMTQTPDLLLGFSLLDRWFVDARVSPDPGATRYAMGYRGAPGEVLEELRVGNSGIGLPDRPFVALGDGGPYSFGALARAGMGDFEGSALLRYDQADRVHRLFAGNREISETTLPAFQFIRGRWFLLPAGATGLSIFVQSAIGSLRADDGSMWRRLGLDEYRYDEGGRVVVLDAVPTTRVAMGWNASSQSDFSIGSQPVALVFDPAAAPFSYDLSAPLARPVEILSHYAMVVSGGEVFVRDRASGKRLADFVAIAGDDGTVEIRPTSAPLSDPRPLAALESDLYRQVPGSTAIAAYANLDEFQIVAQAFSAGEGIPLDADAIESSIEILRDGIPDTAFEVDRTKGQIVLLRPPSAGERIDVSYLRSSSDRRSGALSAGLLGSFQHDEVSAWAALTGHLGVPGQGYAEAGQDSPAWTSLVFGGAKTAGRLTWKAGIAGRAELAESSGRYRIDGMEESGNASSPYWPAGGSPPGGVSCVQVDDPSFSGDWPRLDATLHADGSSPKAIAISTSAILTGPARFMRIVDNPPLVAFDSFVFFAKSASGSSGTLTVSIDDGSGGHQALAVAIPLADVSGSWTRVRYNFSTGRLTIGKAEGAAETIDPFATASRDPLVTSASRVVIGLSSDTSPGSVVDIDEILLEDPLGTLSLDFEGDLRYRDPELRLGLPGLAVISGLEATASLGGGLASSSWAYSGLGLKSGIGPLSVDVGLGIDARSSAIAVAGRHDLIFAAPWSPLTLEDAFSPALGSDGYSKSDKGRIALGPLGSIGGEASSIFSDDPLSSDPGLSRRSWKLSLDDGLLGATALADESSRSTGRFSSADRYWDRWLGSFEDYLPLPLGTFSNRDLSLELDFLPLLGSPLFSAKEVLDADAAAADRGTALELRMSGAIPLPGAITAKPWYARTWKARWPGLDADLVAFGQAGLDNLLSAALPWTSIPFAEFASAATASRFAELALGGSYSTASYVPELGLGFERQPGLFVWQLLVPSKVDFSWQRRLESDGIVVRELSRLGADAVFSGLQLFGSEGVYPLLTSYANDEYRFGVSTSIDLPPGGEVLAWTFSQDGMASLLGDRPDNSGHLAVSERYGYSAGPASTSWTLKGGLDWSEILVRSWLLSLFEIATRPIQAIGGTTSAALDSAWLRDLGSGRPVARRIATLDAGLSSTSGDDPTASPAFSFGESLESRVSIPDRLDAWTKIRLGQTLDGTAFLRLLFELSLGLTLSF